MTAVEKKNGPVEFLSLQIQLPPGSKYIFGCGYSKIQYILDIENYNPSIYFHVKAKKGHATDISIICIDPGGVKIATMVTSREEEYNSLSN